MNLVCRSDIKQVAGRRKTSKRVKEMKYKSQLREVQELHKRSTRIGQKMYKKRMTEVLRYCALYEEYNAKLCPLLYLFE